MDTNGVANALVGRLVARADLLAEIVRAGERGDRASFRRAVEALIAEERANQHRVLADRLERNLRSNGSVAGPVFDSAPEAVEDLVRVADPVRSLSDLVLPRQVLRTCTELLEEHHRGELLRSYSLEPRNRVLLVGPPGNGKTSLGEALANGLFLPLVSVRYESLVGSFLGETANRLRRVFDYVRSRRCVLFFDEFDTVAKERGDIHETGEIKRVVSSLLLQIDQVPSHVMVIAATNHPELLDRAAWRRFQLRLLLHPPGRAQVIEWLRRFRTSTDLDLNPFAVRVAERFKGTSFGDLEEFAHLVRRRWVLAQPAPRLPLIVSDALREFESRSDPANRGRWP